MPNLTTQDLIQFFLNPEGRIRRIPFLLGNISIYILWGIVLKFASKTPDNAFAFFILLPLGLLILYSSFILNIKRLHDVNHSGWFCLAYFIPLVNIFLFFYLLLKAPVDFDNRY